MITALHLRKIFFITLRSYDVKKTFPYISHIQYRRQFLFAREIVFFFFGNTYCPNNEYLDTGKNLLKSKSVLKFPTIHRIKRRQRLIGYAALLFTDCNCIRYYHCAMWRCQKITTFYV